MGHVVKGTYFMAGLNNPSELATLDGASNYVSFDGKSNISPAISEMIRIVDNFKTKIV